MADDLMESIEPFKFQSRGFQTAYLSGYLADKYDVSEKRASTAHDRMKKSAEEVTGRYSEGLCFCCSRKYKRKYFRRKSTVCTVSGMDSEYNMER